MQSVKSADGTQIAYEKQGSGPAVILIDGALCSMALGPMKALAAQLAARFTVFRYDRRGRNRSGDTKPYSVAREIEDLAALIQAAGGSAMVLGVSSGAALAIYAAEKGLGIRKLALYEPPFLLKEEEKKKSLKNKAEIQKLISEDRRNEAVKYFLLQIVGLPSFLGFVMRLTPVWSKLKAVVPTLPYDLEILGDGSIPAEALSKLRAPAIAIGGEKSPEVLVTSVTEVAKLLPGGKPILLAGQNHNLSPKRVAPVLEEFFLR